VFEMKVQGAEAEEALAAEAKIVAARIKEETRGAPGTGKPGKGLTVSTSMQNFPTTGFGDDLGGGTEVSRPPTKEGQKKGRFIIRDLEAGGEPIQVRGNGDRPILGKSSYGVCRTRGANMVESGYRVASSPSLSHRYSLPQPVGPVHNHLYNSRTHKSRNHHHQYIICPHHRPNHSVLSPMKLIMTPTTISLQAPLSLVPHYLQL